MPEILRSPLIHTPRNLPEFLRLWRRFPDALLLTGGTYLIREPLLRRTSWPTVIFLSEIEELARIIKTERYLEIGAGVNLNQLLELGPPILPDLITCCLRGIGSLPIRNMATVGGNLGVRDRRMDLSYPLGLLDTKIEIRTHLHPAVPHWIGWNQLVGEFYDNKNAPSLFISRIRIPENEGNLPFYRKIGYTGPEGEETRLVFCGQARIFKDTLEDFRYLCGIGNKETLRDRNLETALTGRRIPIPQREQESILNAFGKTLPEEGFERDTFLALMEEFFALIRESAYSGL